MPEKPDYDGSTALKSIRQELFVSSILEGMSQCAAYRKAGYNCADASLTSKAAQIVANSNVSRRIAHKRAEIAEKADIHVGLVVREWLRLGLSNIKDFVQCKGGKYVFTDWDQIDLGKLAAVESIQVTETTVGSGKDARTSQNTRFKLYNKLPALEQLAKLKGAYAEDNAQKQPLTFNLVRFGSQAAITGPESPSKALTPAEGTVEPPIAAEFESKDTESIKENHEV